MPPDGRAEITLFSTGSKLPPQLVFGDNGYIFTEQIKASIVKGQVCPNRCVMHVVGHVMVISLPFSFPSTSLGLNYVLIHFEGIEIDFHIVGES